MGLPAAPITLTIEQIDELNQRLSKARHSINNHLALIVAATELIKANPEMLPRMLKTLSEQPPKITDELRLFSTHFERTLGIEQT